jgi:hypothetical protein
MHRETVSLCIIVIDSLTTFNSRYLPLGKYSSFINFRISFSLMA